MAERKLFRFHWDCGRQGDVEGVFVATLDEVNESMGMDVRFGEVLGKHSDIHGTLEQDDIEMLTDDLDFIEKAESFGLVPSGFNPLSYLNLE